MQWFRSDQLYTGDRLIENALWAVEHHRIARLMTLSEGEDIPAGCLHLEGIVTPGLIDVQVNGGGGVLFNQQTHLDGLTRMVEAHQRFGTTGMLPTIITERADVMQRAADVIAEARALGMHQVLGVHFEGPHLSKMKPGIHPTQKMRGVTDTELALYTRKDLGCVMLTVAPEEVPVDVIRELVSHGVIVSLGHSHADSDAVLEAFDAGASGVTHLFNAMSGLTARQPGMIGASLCHASSYAGLIVDGYHVNPLNVSLAIKVLGADRVALVTDAMAHVGSEQQVFPYEEAHIIRQGDKLTLADGTLAGSALDMASALRNTLHTGFAPLDVVKMASRTPARWLGLSDRGVFREGAFADWCQFDEHFHLRRVFVKGQNTHV